MKKSYLLGVLCACVISLASIPAYAVSLTFVYETVVDFDVGGDTEFNDFLGETLTLSFTFDSSTSPDGFGNYAPVTAATATLGSSTYTFSGVNGIVTFNGATEDQYVVTIAMTGPPVDGLTVDGVLLRFLGGDPSLFSSDAPPTVQPDPDDFTTTTLSLEFGGLGTDRFGGTVVASVVPIPGALWLFGSGLLGLVSMARRKKVA